jgi:hypothetical protein
MEKVRYEVPIDDFLYREFNKDKSINSFFKASRVGKCMQLIDEYYLEVRGEISKDGWKDYYLSKINRENLVQASNFIKEKYKIDLTTASEYVFHRVVGQTWNGFLSEINCVDNLREYFPNLEFRKTPYEIDEEYCTDWEAYSNDKLVFGVQMKPESYQYMRTPYQLKVKEFHEAQVEKYKQRFGVGHFFVYHYKGKFIHSQPLIDKINTYLLMNIRVNL